MEKIGYKINDFTLIEYCEPKVRINGAKRIMAIFQCSCGESKSRDYSSVILGHNKSCVKCAAKKRGANRSKHYLIKHPLYRKWQDMKKRCYNKNVQRYSCYGKLGIIVCDEWKNDFKKFYDWSIMNGWFEGMTIDRKNVNGNYEPNNCRYISYLEQSYNKKNTLYVSINNINYSLSRLLRVNNMSNIYTKLHHKLNRGYTINELISKYNINVELYDTIKL